MNAVGLVWANLHRRPVRTYLTLFSVLVAFLLFTMLRMMAVFFTTSSEITAVDRLLVTAKYSIIESLPISQRSEILAVDGVEAVTHQTWFGGIYKDRSHQFFPKYPVEPRAYFDMYPEMTIAPEQLDAFQTTRTGAVAPAALLERFGWSIGDKIPIEADIYPQQDGNRIWVFDLVGSYRLQDEDAGQPPFLFHYDYFTEAAAFGRGAVGWYTVRIADPDRAPEVAGAIDAVFENSQNPTKTATEDEFARAFAAQIGDIGLLANSILSAVFFTILVLTAVVMHWAFRERIAELAVLKTIGFSDGRVAAFVLGESVLLCGLGGLLGVGVGLLGTPALNSMVEQFGLGGLRLDWPTVWQGVGIAVLLGLLVGVAPALLARRLTIAEALRRS